MPDSTLRFAKVRHGFLKLASSIKRIACREQTNNREREERDLESKLYVRRSHDKLAIKEKNARQGGCAQHLQHKFSSSTKSGHHYRAAQEPKWQTWSQEQERFFAAAAKKLFLRGASNFLIIPEDAFARLRGSTRAYLFLVRLIRKMKVLEIIWHLPAPASSPSGDLRLHYWVVFMWNTKKCDKHNRGRKLRRGTSALSAFSGYMLIYLGQRGNKYFTASQRYVCVLKYSWRNMHNDNEIYHTFIEKEKTRKFWKYDFLITMIWSALFTILAS